MVLIHGWPLSGASWERQVTALLEAGYRVITYDRRGFGDSDRPAIGYDYDTLADDLNTASWTTSIFCNVVLVGFSMGAGEVVRYLGPRLLTRRPGRLHRPPSRRSCSRPATTPRASTARSSTTCGGRSSTTGPAYLTRFFENFYNLDVWGGSRVSEEVVRLSWDVAAGASPIGTLACVGTWLTDFRDDLARIDVPVLVIHGGEDRVMPIEATGDRLHKALDDSRYVVIKDAPHGLCWTHADEVNRALLDFLGECPPVNVPVAAPR